MTAYEEAMAELVRRVSDLEIRLQSTRDASADVFEAIKTRLEALETHLMPKVDMSGQHKFDPQMIGGSCRVCGWSNAMPYRTCPWPR